MTPYDGGVVADTSGMSENANPYAEGTDAHAKWAEGYESAPDDSEQD